MNDSLAVPPFQPPRTRDSQRRVSTRRQSHASYASWISSLANPNATPITPPPPVPAISIDLHSPASTVRTVRLTDAPISRVASPFDIEGESRSTSTHDEKEITHIKYGMTTVEEVSEQPASPLTRVGKARSIVDGFVSGLRNLPRAMTHSQLYDRRSLGRESSRASQFTEQYATGTDFSHDGEMSLKYPPPGPFTFPFVFAPPFGVPPMIEGSVPMSMSHTGTSKMGSETTDSETRSGRIANLLVEIGRMPWISPRVAVDYIPGERRSTRGSAKTSSSWYTITAPATPSEIANPWETLPEPWFPPTELPVTVEEPMAEEEAADDEENAEERLKEIREELQEKARQLGDLRQIVEHQKMHISSLEGELVELRKADEADLHRRKSSVRSRTLRTRESLRVSRHTSVRVSRPPSSFFD